MELEAAQAQRCFSLEEVSWGKVVVSEGREVTDSHRSSFTGAQGQPSLLVCVGGEHLLGGQGGGGGAHIHPGEDPEGTRNPSKGNGQVQHPTQPGRTHLLNLPTASKGMAPPEPHRKGLPCLGC